MISLRFDKNKKEKKINLKVVATSVVAITLIGIVGISIGKYSGQNLMGPGIILDGVASIESGLNKGFNFLQSK